MWWGSDRRWTFLWSETSITSLTFDKTPEKVYPGKEDNGRYIYLSCMKNSSHLNLHFGHGWLSQPHFADLGHETALCRPGIILGGSSICALLTCFTRANVALHFKPHFCPALCRQTEGKIHIVPRAPLLIIIAGHLVWASLCTCL